MPPILLLCSLLICFVDFATTRLVINESQVGELSARMIREHAEVVEVNKYPNVWKGKKCDGVEDQRTLYKFYIIGDDGQEEEKTVEISEILPEARKEFISSSAEHQLWMDATVTLWTELNCMEQDDKQLLAGLREEFLQAPSYEGYNQTMISVPLQSLPFKYSNYQYSQYGQVIRSDVFWYLTFELPAEKFNYRNAHCLFTSNTQDVFLDKHVFKQSVTVGK